MLATSGPRHPARDAEVCDPEKILDGELEGNELPHIAITVMALEKIEEGSEEFCGWGLVGGEGVLARAETTRICPAKRRQKKCQTNHNFNEADTFRSLPHMNSDIKAACYVCSVVTKIDEQYKLCYVSKRW